MIQKTNQVLALQLLLGIVLFSSEPVLAVPQLLSNQASQSEKTLEFRVPSRGAPGQRKDAGSRMPSDSSFLAIIPKMNIGLTTSARPTFWLYLSPSFSCQHLGITLLENGGNTEQIFHRSQIDVASTKGLISYQLPESAPPLKMGEQYLWVFSCGANARYGVIERVSLTAQLERQLQQASPRERVRLWAINGLWYEAISELIRLRGSNPQDTRLKADWSNLLQHPDVDLKELVGIEFTNM